MTDQDQQLPLLPLRDVVVYPNMVLPLFVGRERSIEALEHAMQDNKQVLLVAQRNAADDEPGVDDLYQVGTVSNILQLLKLPDGTIKVLVEGGYRAAVLAIDDGVDFAVASVRQIETDSVGKKESASLVKETVEQFEKYVGLSKKVPSEVLTSLSGIDDPGRLADTISAHMGVDLEEKQRILEIADVRGRLEHLQSLMNAEIDLFQVEKRIRGRVKKQMEKSQREYYLNEQMKAIQKELGEMDDAPNEIDDLQTKINDARMPPEALEKANAELGKLKMMSPMSAEASVVRGFLDWMVSIPWFKRSKVRHDLKRAQAVWTRITSDSRRSKSAFWNIWRFRSASESSRDRFFVWLGRPAWARLRLANRLRDRLTANLFAWRWVAFETRPKFAAIAGPISVPCPGNCCKRCPRPGSRTHSFCSMKSIRWEWITGVTRLQPCSRSWTLNRTTHLTTTIWRSITTCQT